MLEPDSRLLTALLITASAALLVAAIRLRLLPVKTLCGALSIMVAMTGGIAAVNYYYGYYTTWGAAVRPTSTAAPATSASSRQLPSTTALGSGRLGWVDLPRQAQRLQPARPGVPAAAVRRGPVRAAAVPGRRAVPRHPRHPARLEQPCCGSARSRTRCWPGT